MITVRRCLVASAALSALLHCTRAAERPWQSIAIPSAAEAARSFEDPPAEFGLTMWWFWNGDMTEANIRRDLEEMKARRIRAVMIWPYVGLVHLEYLSPAWFERVQFAVRQARELDLRVWLMDEGCYPSGFAGGRITRDRPWQRMQVLLPRSSPGGGIEVGPEFRTPPTRYIHTPGFRKDTTYSLFDALDPAATRDFLSDVHEQYKKYIGGEFGRTVLGFMGDEPSFPGVPYTARIYDEFRNRKGYDVRPHLPKLFMKDPTDGARRIRADYWDVWTSLYRDSYFKPQGDWCARENLEFLMHICDEDNMKGLVELNGDYFRCMSPVQVPGVDAIWRQIWPGKTADYPKLASSAAHLRGRPRAFSEGYAVYGRGLSVEQAKWVLDHHLARGINLFQAMSFLSSREEFRPYFCPPDLNVSPLWPFFSQLFAYANRMSYLLSSGVPTASIALYYPTTSAWMGDFSADSAGLAIARELLEGQRDFDFVDEDSLCQVLRNESGSLVNLSGQRYRAVLVPPLKTITQSALDRLREFAQAGGRVVFFGKFPELIAGKTYLDAVKGPAALPWAVLEPAVALTPRASSQLPEPDLRIEAAMAGAAVPSVKYQHRRFRDAELYFLFNEAERAVQATVLLEGHGEPQVWDAVTGGILGASSWTRAGRLVRLRLVLEPGESRTIVLTEALPKPVRKENHFTEAGVAMDLSGSWEFTIQGRRLSGPLRSWSECGAPSFSGTVLYSRRFEFGDEVPPASGRELRLDLGTVKYAARVRLNGRDLGRLAWGPFRWVVGDAIRPGPNLLEVEVTNTAANELSGDPTRLKELEEKGYLKNSYIRIYAPFDAEMVSSGLLGPVRLVWCRKE